MLPQAGWDPGPVTPWGMVALVHPTWALLAGQGAKLLPWEMHRSGGELNTIQSTVGVQGLENSEALLSY